MSEATLESRREAAPIPATLDLWSLGHSASQVADMLGFQSHRQVTKIIEHARSIRDPRAVLHAASNGRLIGRPGRMDTPPAVEVVPAIPNRAQAICLNGHDRTSENVEARRCCICRRAQDKARHAANALRCRA